MKRSILAVIAGAVIWSLLYQSSFPALKAVWPDVWGGTTIDSAPALAAFLVFTFACSVLAGYITGVVSKAREVTHALALGVLQLIMGTIAEVVFWDYTPAWYHLIFLALLIPGNVSGGWLRHKQTLSGPPVPHTA